MRSVPLVLAIAPMDESESNETGSEPEPPSMVTLLFDTSSVLAPCGVYVVCVLCVMFEENEPDGVVLLVILLLCIPATSVECSTEAAVEGIVIKLVSRVLGTFCSCVVELLPLLEKGDPVEPPKRNRQALKP